MNIPERKYIAIDLKSFYASVECVERKLDPLDTNLVVADLSRTDKTICLAVTPSLKSYGISGRARLFEVVRRVEDINLQRKMHAPGGILRGSSCSYRELQANPSFALDYMVAPPQMSLYISRSSEIFGIYLKYVSAEDIHVYSIDEVFIDVTPYLRTYRCSARELAMTMIKDVLEHTGITATAGIGTNLYLCKVAMDIVAKHIPADKDGVRIAELNELSYRQLLWSHRPLREFWRVGRGYSRKLEAHGLFTMGDIARCSLGKRDEFHNEELLYRLFGVNAELLIDHAWGWEPCTIADIKAYKPSSKSLSSGQVLSQPYPFDKAKLIVREMTELLVLRLVSKRLVTDQIILTVCYDRKNLSDPETSSKYSGNVAKDFYGRTVPKPAHGSANLDRRTSSTRLIVDKMMELFDRIVLPDLCVRRIYVVANRLTSKDTSSKEKFTYRQLDIFMDTPPNDELRLQDEHNLVREERLQTAILAIQKKYGKNAILKGMNYQEGATTLERNRQIGGHKA